MRRDQGGAFPSGCKAHPATEELRAALRRHQIDGYGALMKAAAAAIIVLARDPRWVGGIVGVLAVGSIAAP